MTTGPARSGGIGTGDRHLARALDAVRCVESMVAPLVAAGAVDHAALLAEVGAQLAASSHAGVFASPALEEGLAAASARLSVPDVPRPRAPWTPAPRRVLHVATILNFPEGGHPRAIERWVRSDAGRTHSLAVTYPRGGVPDSLRGTVEASGGEVHRLAPRSCSFAERAAHLRRLAAENDVVVLHTHAYDALPLLALAFPGRPPTLMNNHAGHTFWLGRAVSDLVLCGRNAARAICVERRGIPEENCVVLPVAVDEPAPARRDARARLRAELGVDSDQLLLLTVGSEFKLRPAAGFDLAATTEAALARSRHAVWRLVGPEPAGRWAQLAERTGGRARALGPRHDVPEMYAAADAYLDSFPFSSQTAMLDAAAAGLPVMAARWHATEAGILSAWGGMLDSELLAFDDEASLAHLIDRAANHGIRESLGMSARQAVSGALVGPAWRTLLEPNYGRAAERALRRSPDGLVPAGEPSRATPGELDRWLAMLYAGGPSMKDLLNWHRFETNWGAATAFPGGEAALAEAGGLAGLSVLLGLIIRDYEAALSRRSPDESSPGG